MNTIYFDFDKIATNKDFYAQMGEQLQLPEHFGNNLDALHDLLAGYLELPLMFYFNNMSEKKFSDFEELVATLDDAENETQGQFTYDYDAGEEDRTN
ncbi:MAG: barstar family protein [Tannerella sp.]|jgi:ribonuclease inhibitor|nr:barstar family protein [Tannerella sp.]